MYLKNNSDKFQCGLRTKKEVLTINPGEAVHVFDSDILAMNSKLIQITESEYNKIKKSTKDVESEKHESAQDETKSEIKDEKTGDEIKSDDTENTENSEVIETQNEDKTDDTNTNKVEKTELEQLEETLEALKKKWEETDKPSKKAQIQKKIKEVQTQIANLK